MEINILILMSNCLKLLGHTNIFYLGPLCKNNYMTIKHGVYQTVKLRENRNYSEKTGKNQGI